MQWTVSHNNGFRRFLAVILTALLVCNTIGPAFAWNDGSASITGSEFPATGNDIPAPDEDEELAPEEDIAPKPINVVDTWINYDLRFRLARIIWRNISEAIWKGEPINFEKIKFEVCEPSIVAHLISDRGAVLLGEGLKWACKSFYPPYGTIVSSFVAEIMKGMGGAIGYEMSDDMKGETNRRFGEVLGLAMKRIDVMGFAGMTMGSLFGSAIGQTIIPIPILGASVGGLIGAIIGGAVSNYFIKTELGKALGTNLQKSWNRGADLWLKFVRWRAATMPRETLWQKLKKNLKGTKSLYTPNYIPERPLPPIHLTGQDGAQGDELPKSVGSSNIKDFLKRNGPPKSIHIEDGGEEEMVPDDVDDGEEVAEPEVTEESAGGYERQLERLGSMKSRHRP